MQYMTIAEVADLLRVSERTVWRMCRAGQLQGARKLVPDNPRSPWRIPESAVYPVQIGSREGTD